jgi:hypothetical protein
MYDTINFSINNNGTIKTLETSKKNYNIEIKENVIEIEVSLCKYFHGQNADTLKFKEVEIAVKKLCANLDIDNAKVNRIDFSTVLTVENAPTYYYKYFGELAGYNRVIYKNSLYYNSDNETVLFYDKTKELEAKGVKKPKKYKGKNLLRYEIRYFNTEGIFIKDLYNKDFFNSLVYLWRKKYKTINKVINTTDKDLKKAQRHGLEKCLTSSRKATYELKKLKRPAKDRNKRVRSIDYIYKDIFNNQTYKDIKEIDTKIQTVFIRYVRELKKR